MALLDDLIAQIRQGQQLGANELGLGPGFLGRLQDPQLSGNFPGVIQDPAELLARFYGESFIGGQNTSQQDLSLDLLQQLAQSSGQVSPELQEIQNLLMQEFNNARNIDPALQEALGLRREALQGLSSPELTALQESLTRDANRAFTGGLRTGAGQASLGGRQGISPTMQRDLFDDLTRAQLGAAQDTLLADVDVRRQALGGFEDLARHIDTSKFDRAQQTLGNVGDFNTLIDQLMFNKALQSRGLFNQAVEQNVGANRADRENRLLSFRDELQRQQNYNLQRQLINMNNLASEISARTGVSMGIPAFLEQQRANRAAEALQKQAIGAAGSGGGGSGGGFVPGGQQGPEPLPAPNLGGPLP
jgi:hypothetical protein